MSIELHVFLYQTSIPTRDAWQEAIDSLGLPIRLDTALVPKTHRGFSPVILNDKKSGFELYCDSAAELISVYPNLSAHVGNRDAALSFRWGGDLIEAGCAFIAAAALLKIFGAIAYYPDDDIVYLDFQELVSGGRECFDAAGIPL